MNPKLVAPAFLLAAFTALPAAGAQRAFVSSTGNDANVGVGCTLLAQCRSFQAAHAAVDAGGEIVALDTAGYGPVNISKSVTIMANPGIVAGIAAADVDAVSIDADGVEVTLRGLALNNVSGANYGVRMTAGSSLVLENLAISGFTIGVRVQTAARVTIINSVLRGNATGLSAFNGPSVDVSGSHFVGGGAFGVHAGTTVATQTIVSVSDSVATGNL